MSLKPLVTQIGRLSLASTLLLSIGCFDAAMGPTSCDGLADKTVAITRNDYSKCAGEILEAFEKLEAPLRRFVDGDKASKSEAEAAAHRLSHLMGQVGLQSDAFREVQGGSSRTVERWPDSGMREFNAAIIQSSAQLRAALVFPNQDNLQQGINLYARARTAYSSFR